MTEATLQLSAVVGLPSAKEPGTEQVPPYELVLALTVAGAAMVGSTLSSTVTVAVAVSELPPGSVTVRVTVTGDPTSLHEKLVISSDELAMLQLSVEPFSMSQAVMLATPLASSCTVIFCAAATGSVTSCTVTVVAVAALVVDPSVALTQMF